MYNSFCREAIRLKTIGEIENLTGISIRALHHYDDIGLLKPAKVSENGYRLYDENSLLRLRDIMILKELQFSLKEIKEILDSPNYDRKEAISKQIELLRLKYERLGEIITFADKLKNGEENTLNFEVFNNDEITNLKKEAKEKWGNTAAYKECEEKTAGKTNTEMKETGDRMMDIFAEIGALRSKGAKSAEVQKKVKELQEFITGNYYNCTNEIFAGLAEMYVADERFKENIDRAGGIGTAEFVSEAIAIYCMK